MGEGVADFSHEKCGSHLLLKIGLSIERFAVLTFPVWKREGERENVEGDRPNEKMHIIINKL